MADQDWSKTLDQAFERLMLTMSAEMFAALRDTPEGSLILQHFGLGQFTRNEFGMWQGNN